MTVERPLVPPTLRSTSVTLLSLAAVLPCLASPAWSAQRSPDIDKILQSVGASAIRAVDSDICFPATSEEYEALGKNAVVMLTSSSAIGTELPLRSAYVLMKGVRVPLQRIAVFAKAEARRGKDTHTEQVSFYLLPIAFMKSAAKLEVDFRGERTGFGVMTFSADGEAVAGAPAFVRLDSYDNPADPDLSALSSLLAREYPDFFGGPARAQ